MPPYAADPLLPLHSSSLQVDRVFNFLENTCHSQVASPADMTQRGCQLSLIFSMDMEDVHARIAKEGVICDLRKPSVMRIAPAPLYVRTRVCPDACLSYSKWLLRWHLTSHFWKS